MQISVGSGRVDLDRDDLVVGEQYVSITLSDAHVSTTIILKCAEAAQLGETIMRWAAKQGELKVAP